MPTSPCTSRRSDQDAEAPPPRPLWLPVGRQGRRRQHRPARRRRRGLRRHPARGHGRACPGALRCARDRGGGALRSSERARAQLRAARCAGWWRAPVVAQRLARQGPGRRARAARDRRSRRARRPPCARAPTCRGPWRSSTGSRGARSSRAARRATAPYRAVERARPKSGPDGLGRGAGAPRLQPRDVDRPDAPGQAALDLRGRHR